MSDDLVKRLREDQPVTQDMESTMQCALQDEAADRIEELESKLSLRTNLHEECIYLLKSTEAKLAKAVEALGEAIYLLDPDEEDIAKETGLHRIVTTYAELKGESQ